MSSQTSRFANMPWRRIALWVVGLVVLVAVLGFLVAPPIIRSQAEQALSERLHRKVSIGAVRLNPFTLRAEVRDLAVRERGSDEIVLGFDLLTVNVSAATLFRLAPVLQSVRLVKPYARIVRRDDGRYNFQDLIDEARSRPPSDAPPQKFSVNNIELVDGRIVFDDRPHRAVHEVTELRIGIPFVSNLPAAVDITVQPSLAAKVNGSPLELKGEAKPFKDTHEITLDIDLDDLQLPKYLEYSPIDLPLRVPSGSLDTRLQLTFKATPDDRPAQLLLTGEAGLRKLVVQDRGGAPAVSLPALDVAFDPVDLVANRAHLKFLRVEGLEVHAALRKDGSVSLLDLAPRMPAPKPAAPAAQARPFGFSVDEITLRGGRILVRDETPATPFTINFLEVTADVRNLSNAPDRKATAKLSYVTDAKASFAYDGTFGLQPVTVDGRFALGGWQLAVLYPYYADALNVEVVDGRADAEGEISVALPPGGEPVIKASGVAAALKSLKLRYPGEKRLFADIPVLAAKDISADVGARQIAVGQVETQDGVVWVRRLPDGTLLLTRVVKTGADVAASQRPDKDARTWTLGIKAADLANYTVDFDDETVKPMARAELRRVGARIDDFSNAPGARFNVQVKGVVNKTGTVTAAGPLGVNPVGGRVRIDAKGLAIPFAQPFIEDKVNVGITSGLLSARGELAFEVPAQGTTRLLWTGDLSIADFASVDKPTSSDLIKWRSLDLTRVRVQLEPLEASVDQVALADFYARLVLNADGTFNFQNLLATPGAASGGGAVRADGTRGPAPRKPAAAPSTQTGVAAEATEAGAVGAGAEPSRASATTVPATGSGLPANVRVGRITLQGGNVNFSDFFVKPNYTANLTGLGGSVTEITAQKAGDVDLRGRVDNTAPVEIAGRINPLAADLYLDIKASARDIELPPLSPYAIKYAGYGIEKGKLSMNVKYLIENRRLAAENNLYLDQLTFGDKVDSPTATKLPVLLAVSLLKDRNGVIDLNLPISGSLDDPQFSIGGIIVQVIVNLLTKIVTAPFSALAAAFGSKEELSYVDYAAGSATLDGEAKKRLDALGKALADRPQLKLDIAGQVDPAADREGLKTAAVQDKVRAQKLKRLIRDGKTPANADEVTIDKDEYAALLKAAYGEESFPKPRNAIGLAKDLPVAEMENLMLANTTVGDEDLRRLANRRAQVAKDYLVDTAKVPAERVFLIAPVTAGAAPKDKGPATRAAFAIK